MNMKSYMAYYFHIGIGNGGRTPLVPNHEHEVCPGLQLVDMVAHTTNFEPEQLDQLKIAIRQEDI